MRSFSPYNFLCITLLLLSACASQRGTTQPAAPHYKVGQPYEINGIWYTPQEDYSYDETGVASWYGQQFHDHVTANGEVFNKNELTAAHRTLPMPSLARVTNLDNGRSIVVRVNDRGPYASGRIMDVSQRAAQLLGFEQQGTAKVRVQVLADESKAIADAMRRYGGSTQPAVTTATMETPTTSHPIQSAALASVETKQLEPIRTTAEIHQQLLQTTPAQTVNIIPVTGHNRLYVQAGAFTNLENAIRLQHSLSRLGKTSISDVVINGKLFHRVRVGPIADVAQADQTLARVHQAGAVTARTIVD